MAMLEDYKVFVREHPEQVKRTEELGRLVAMFLPVSRFGRYSGVFQESSYSVLGLVSLYHDRIIKGAKAKREATEPKHIRAIRLMLTLLTHTEVVIEMLTRIIGGERARMQCIYFLEWVKAATRLILLGRTKAGEMLLTGGHFEAKGTRKSGLLAGAEPEAQVVEVVEEDDQLDASASEPQGQQGKGDEESDLQQNTPPSPPPRWQGRRSGKVLQLPDGLKAFDNVAATETSTDAVQTPSTGENATAGGENKTSTTLSQTKPEAGPEDNILRLSGEVLHILRPVFYVAYLRRLGKRGLKSWRPFFMSLFLELLSLRCSSVAVAPGTVSNTAGLKRDEIATRAVNKILYGKPVSAGKRGDEELRRRRTLLPLYFARSPLFERLTLPIIRKAAGGLSFLPAVGESLETAIVDNVMYYQRNHFYTSGS